MLLGMPPEDLLNEEDTFQQILKQALIEQALRTQEKLMKQQAILYANNMARLYRR